MSTWPTRTRGDALIHAGVLPLAGGGLSAPVDITIRHGVITGVHPTTSAPPRDPDGTTVVDADGRIALPGLIDAHVHAEATVFEPDVQLALLRQGITAIVTGQDGVSFAPSAFAPSAFAPSADHSPSHRPPTSLDHATASAGTIPPFNATAWASGYFAAINGTHPTFARGGVGDLLATYAGTTPLNVAYTVPHGTVRYAVMGAENRPATGDEIEHMVALLQEGLDQGACGMSTGLEYVPAAYADDAELMALARVLADRGLPHSSHMRGYEEKAGGAFAELRRIAEATGVSTHIAHYHGPSEELSGYVNDARATGLDVTFDSYPYLRGCSILSMVALPTWLPLADPQATLAALDRPDVTENLSRHFAGLADLWPRITMAAVPGEHSWTEGMTLLSVATQLGLTPADAALTLLRSTRLRASCVFAQPPTNSPESMRALAHHEVHMAGSDAIYLGGAPHPRGWGAFARFLGWAADGQWSWHEAVQHLSARAARRFRFPGRGTLTTGSAGDVVLVDPGALRAEATYADPRRPASGIDDVLVAGVRVLAAGALTGATPGAPLLSAPGTRASR